MNTLSDDLRDLITEVLQNPKTFEEEDFREEKIEIYRNIIRESFGKYFELEE